VFFGDGSKVICGDGGAQGGGVAAADLVGLWGLIWIHKLIAGADDGDAGEGGNAEGGCSTGGRDGEFGSMKAGASGE